MSNKFLTSLITLLVFAIAPFQIYAVENVELSSEDENFYIDEELQHANYNRSKRYKAYSSKEMQFVWFRVYKVASTTLLDFFEKDVPDLTKSRPEKGLPKKFMKYFKFAFVRNPWDRIVSCYFQKIVTKKYPLFQACFDKDFEFFIDYINRLDVSKANAHIRLQTKLIPVHLCDFIGKLDHFEEDLKYVTDVIGIKMPLLSCKNKSEHAHYSTYYNDRTRQIIAEKYKEDIDAFGFTFEAK